MKRPKPERQIRKSGSVRSPEMTFYRCPACGEEVDQTDRLAMAQHHQHVLHPSLFRNFFRATGDASVGRVTSEK